MIENVVKRLLYEIWQYPSHTEENHRPKFQYVRTRYEFFRYPGTKMVYGRWCKVRHQVRQYWVTGFKELKVATIEQAKEEVQQIEGNIDDVFVTNEFRCQSLGNDRERYEITLIKWSDCDELQDTHQRGGE